MRLLTFLLFFSISLSQTFSTYDYVGSRATAMSGSITSGPSGEWSIFHNPAQLSDLDQSIMTSGICQIYNLDFLSYSHFGLANNGWGINFEQMATEINNKTLSKESVLGISRGIQLYKDRQSILQSGIRLNLYSYNLGKSAGLEGDGSAGINLGSGSAQGIDLGFQGILNHKYYIGYYMQNVISYIDSPSLGSNLPKSFSIGLSYKPYQDLLTSLDINQLSGHTDSEIRFGIEYQVIESFKIRTGLQSNPNRFSGGFELSKLNIGNNNLSIAYSFLTHHVLPMTHQFSISLDF